MDYDWRAIRELYQHCIAGGVIEYLQNQQTGRRVRRGIYSASVVIWLMILQRLHTRGTLATAVQLLLAGGADCLLAPCRRVRQGRISSRTGGWSRSRQKLPKLLCRQVANELVARLRRLLNPNRARTVYLIDGSSLELEARGELLKAYPPASNQHGESHWPVLRIGVLHDVETGLAEQPCWGPMYGAQAVSEQALAEQLMAAVPPGSVILGDRNFGVFSVAWAGRQCGHEVIIRLKDDRVRKLAQTPISAEGERPVTWQPSRAERRKHGFPEEAAIAGRLVAMRVGRGQSRQWLYLFTTLSDLSAEDLVKLYGRRWNIETDLRSLKRTVRLHHIAARSAAMMEKELLTAIAAYNLVRAVMALAARRHHMQPRQLSFTFVLNVVEASWPRLSTATTAEQQARELEAILERAAQGTLPQRSKPRSYPRAVWHHRRDFPNRKEEK